MSEIFFQVLGFASILSLLLSGLFLIRSYVSLTGSNLKTFSRAQKPSLSELSRKIQTGEVTDEKVKIYFRWYKITQRVAISLLAITILLMLVNGATLSQ